MVEFPRRSKASRYISRAAVWFRDVFAIVGITIFLLLSAELAARVIDWVRHGTTDPDMRVDPTPLYASDYSPEWNAAYIREFRASGHLQWEPYVYWRRVPHAGQYINVDADGHRKTYNHTPHSEAKTKVFVFGGSTVWGPWIRDDYTIPSDLSRVLEGKGYSGVHVSNLAESGHVSTQSLLTLVQQLRTGNIPDVAIFLEGVNDTFSAFQNREAGIPLNEGHRRLEFNASKRPTRLIALLVRTSKLAEAADHLADRLRRPLARRTTVRTSPAGPVPSTDALVEETVAAYLTNVRIAKALAADYGFEAFFFWQPSLFSKQVRSSTESNLLTRYPPGLVAFFDQVASRLAAVAPQVERLYDLQDLFDDDSETVFVDYTHIREPKNVRVAEAIGSVLDQALSSRRQ